MGCVKVKKIMRIGKRMSRFLGKSRQLKIAHQVGAKSSKKVVGLSKIVRSVLNVVISQLN